MTGSVIQLAMNFGYPGSYARMPDDIVIAKPVKASTDAIPFGYAVMLNTDNTFQKGDATLTAANFAGIAVREVRQALVLNDDQGSYAALTPCDVLVRGNTVIKLARGTATAGGAVNFRIAAQTSATKAFSSYEGPIGNGNTVTFNGNTYTIGDGTSSTTTVANLVTAANTYQADSASYTDSVLKIKFQATTAGSAGTAPTLEVAAGEGAAVNAVVVKPGVDAVSGSAVGDFEAGDVIADYTIALPNVVFTTGEVDANGIVEVSIKTRNNN